MDFPVVVPTFVRDALRCPACGTHPLPVSEHGATCEGCAADYRFHHGFLDLMPQSPPGFLRERWDLWSQLQDNGNACYSLAPEINLTNDVTLDIERFKAFMGLDGSVLDVGCGPQRWIPDYIDAAVVEYVGLDPIPGSEERDFPYFRAIGECLPFADGSFNHVLFVSSLDHTLAWRRALEEGARVLAPGGAIHIMADDVDDTPKNRGLKARLEIIRKGARQALRGLRTMGFARTVRYLGRAVSVSRPEGAIDPFHVEFPNPCDILQTLEELGLSSIRTDSRDGIVLINACRG